MKTGLFYKLEETPISNIQSFRYLRRPYDLPKKEGREALSYHIYLVIQPYTMEWFYTVDEGAAHARLFKLSLGGSFNSHGIFSQQLNKIKESLIYSIPAPTIHIPTAHFRKEEIHSLGPQRFEQFDHYSNLFWLEKPQDYSSGIFFPDLLLDFLFDLMHSNIFRESSYFENIRSTIQDSLLLSAICKKAEYLYQQSQYENCVQEDPSWSIVRRDFENATQQWIDTLLDPEMPTIHKSSPWFAEDQNLEDEMKAVLFPTSISKVDNESIQIYSQALIKLEQCEAIMNFQMGRLNLMEAWSLLNGYFKLTGHLILLSAVILSIPLFFLVSQEAGWLSLVLGGLIMGTLYSQKEGIELETKPTISMKPNTPKDVLPSQKVFSEEISTHSFLTLLMPRLLITIFIAWLSLGAIVTKAPNLELPASLGYAIVLTTLIWFYLFQEVRKVAPDLSPKQQQLRPFLIILIAYCYSALIGAVVLSVGYQNYEGDIPHTVQYFGYDLIANAWCTTMIWAVFFGLFI
ncbi:MAG: hypothetical protein AAFY70_18095, partial [Bacteroidota bacterium]